VIEPLPEPPRIKRLTPRGGPRLEGGGCRPNRSAKAEEALRNETKEQLHRPDEQVTERLRVAESVVLDPRGVLCRANAVSARRRQRNRGVNNPPVFPGPGPGSGVAHAPLVASFLSAEIARVKSFARRCELATGTPFWSHLDSAFDSQPE
jgi:hypothetical protein